MSGEDFAAAKELFHRAVLLPEEERNAFLVSDCANPDVLETVRQLLEAKQRMGNHLNGPLFSFEARLTAPEEIGPYRVEREIGRGGMATVFLARRADSLYDKPVAIKLIDRPLWRPDDIARFRREIRILASLSHPYIVGLLEGNRGSDGRLYIVMEFVEGQLLNEWKSSRSPSLQETMRVYLQLCDAVSYAHRNLIVHRDLKPSNVLVTPRGEAKLLDFGIAKLLGTKTTR